MKNGKILECFKSERYSQRNLCTLNFGILLQQHPFLVGKTHLPVEIDSHKEIFCLGEGDRRQLAIQGRTQVDH